MVRAAAHSIGRGTGASTMRKGENMGPMVGPAVRRGILVALTIGGAVLVLAGVFTGRASVGCAGLACLLGVNIALAHASRLRISSTWSDLREKFRAVESISRALEVIRRSQLLMHKKIGLSEQERSRESRRFASWQSDTDGKIAEIEERLREIHSAFGSVETAQRKAAQEQRTVRATLAALQADSHDVGRMVDGLGMQARSVSQEMLRFQREILGVHEEGVVWHQGIETGLAALQTETHDVGRRVEILTGEVISGKGRATQTLTQVEERLEYLERAVDSMRRDLTSHEGSGIAAKIGAIAHETAKFDKFGQVLESVGNELAARRAAIEHSNTSGKEIRSRLQALKEKLEQMEPKLIATLGVVEALSNDGGRTSESSGAVDKPPAGERDSGVYLEDSLEARRILGWLKDEVGQDVEAVVQLYQLLRPSEVSMLLGRGAMDPTAMLGVIRQLLERSPDLVVEVGSGASTTWLGYALKRAGRGRLISLEHSPEYYEIVQKQLEAHELLDVVDLRLAPLEEYEIGGHGYPWYARSAISFDRAIDILLVDGPPAPTHPIARYPALPLLVNELSPSALVVLDDTDRAQEKTIKKKWKAEFGLVSYRTIGPRTQSLVFGDSSG